MTKAEYQLFEELIEGVSGLRQSGGESVPLRAALCERVEATGCSGFGEYYERLRGEGAAGELGRLIELLTVHETAFFRNRSHFEVLSRRVLPELIRRNGPQRTLRVWSAGCSTGQEAYSIAISLLEAIPFLDQWRVEVVATDISLRALETARAGVYSGRTMRNVEPALLDRYFERVGEEYRVGEQVRRLVRFEYLNLVKEPFPLAAFSPCDLIFCENVTIYFKMESTRRVIRNFYDALSEGGYLFLGYSETLWQISDDFRLREMGDTFVYQKPSRDAGSADHGVRGSGSASPPRMVVPPSEIRPARSRTVRAADAAPPRRVATLAEAAALYDAGRHEESLLAVESVLLATPSDPKAHLLAAKLRADREEAGPALRHCRRALDADPLLEEGHYLMGVMLLRSRENAAAAEALSRVIYLSPTGSRSALAHFHLAGLHVGSGEATSAAREYRNALRVLDGLPRDALVGEFSADFLARVCRRKLAELERSA